MFSLFFLFSALEKPHDGEEKFEKNDEEIDINDKTGEGICFIVSWLFPRNCGTP